ncbi:pre-toxin TG domain-containing protein [Clostridium sp. HBUAS56017]|uniref:pre-toxin TG domain-containing protein n=1 Tax=Clostridium sp. HBUAS56017 TaxID=2571128 RepID=UPI0011788E93|nr:pre-toxin TG domain-containing protein [Clostridium sp. HBUAS56017]
MRDFSIDEQVNSRCSNAEYALNNCGRNLYEANRVAKEAVELINSDGGLGYIDYSPLDNEINELFNWSQRYTVFKGLCGYYDSSVDSDFFSEQEDALEDLGLIRIEDISVKNNLGIEESGVTEEGYEYTREKAGLTFQDLLTYEGVSDVMKKQYEEYKENAKNNNEEYIDEYGKYLKQTIEGADVTYEKAWKKWVSLGLDVIPIVGDAKGLVEAVIGMDLITQRKLSDAERALSALSAIPLAGDGAVLIKVGSKYGAKELVKVSGKELIRNVGAMGTGYISMEAAEKAGLPPWVGLLAYQGTRISAMGVSRYGGTVSARVKGVESGGFLDNLRIETPEAYKAFMKNLQEGTKDRAIRLSSLGAGEFERIYRSNENLRKIVTEVDNLGLTAEESKRVRAILDSGDKETIENLAQVVVKYKGDKDRILGFVDEKGASNLYRLTTKDIPSVRNGEFNKFFNSLTSEELDEIWKDPKLRETIEDRLRQPGGLHEWHLVSRTPQFKNWYVTAEQIKDLRSLTTDVKFVNPKGIHGGRGSTTAHNELLKIIDSSADYDTFIRRLNNWANYRLDGGVESLPKGLQRK